MLCVNWIFSFDITFMHLVRLLLGRLGTQFLNEKMKRKKQNRKTNNLGSTVLCADKFNSIILCQTSHRFWHHIKLVEIYAIARYLCTLYSVMIIFVLVINTCRYVVMYLHVCKIIISSTSLFIKLYELIQQFGVSLSITEKALSASNFHLSISNWFANCLYIYFYIDLKRKKKNYIKYM